MKLSRPFQNGLWLRGSPCIFIISSNQKEVVSYIKFTRSHSNEIFKVTNYVAKPRSHFVNPPE